MTTVKPTPRHRKARRPVVPIADFTGAISSITLSPIRGTAVASVTGLALTAAVTSVASAAPVVVADAPDVAAATQVSSQLPTTVSVPDIAWSDSGDVTVTAEATAPAQAEETTTAATTTQAASRTASRSTTSSSTSSAALNPSGSTIVSIALSLQGIPYVYGGSSLSGMDCSGFTQYVYAQAGISIPRTSEAQQAGGTIIPASQAKPGDLLSWGYHVAIYLGNGKMIDSSKPGTTTTVRSIWGSPVYVRY